MKIENVYLRVQYTSFPNTPTRPLKCYSLIKSLSSYKITPTKRGRVYSAPHHKHGDVMSPFSQTRGRYVTFLTNKRLCRPTSQTRGRYVAPHHKEGVVMSIGTLLPCCGDNAVIWLVDGADQSDGVRLLQHGDGVLHLEISQKNYINHNPKCHKG